MATSAQVLADTLDALTTAWLDIMLDPASTPEQIGAVRDEVDRLERELSELRRQQATPAA